MIHNFKQLTWSLRLWSRLADNSCEVLTPSSHSGKQVRVCAFHHSIIYGTPVFATVIVFSTVVGLCQFVCRVLTAIEAQCSCHKNYLSGKKDKLMYKNPVIDLMFSCINSKKIKHYNMNFTNSRQIKYCRTLLYYFCSIIYRTMVCLQWLPILYFYTVTVYKYDNLIVSKLLINVLLALCCPPDRY